MTDLTLLSDVTVELIDAMGSDASIVRAAQVSVKGANDPEAGKGEGLIGYLMREKHGSPFEHNAMTFYVKAPIFVFREFHRHRIGWSYSEMSGRYRELPPEFYVPAPDRALANVGTSARPEFAPGSREQVEATREALVESYAEQWETYRRLLDLGTAKEISRLALPVGLYSQMYATCNLRSLLAFLSLRTHRPDAAHVSRPQREIEMVAEKLEALAAARFPIALAAFNESKRVAP